MAVFGVVLIGFGIWLYWAPSAERFYRQRAPAVLDTMGWMFTAIIPVGVGALLLGIAMAAKPGSLWAQVIGGLGIVCWLIGFALALIHPDRVRPKWLRGRTGD
jgi:hypothetical protein